jgi:hypothetical protein
VEGSFEHGNEISSFPVFPAVFSRCVLMLLGHAVLFAGLPYVRPMPPIPAVAGQQLVVKCPVAGYPIDTIIWEKGKSQHLSLFWAPVTTIVSAGTWNPISKQAFYSHIC